MANASPPRRPSYPPRVVAIDIGTDSVHAVEVHSSPDPRVVKRGSAPLPSPVWEDLASHKDALAAAIKGALSAGGITASHVHTAIPRRLVTLKYARLPHAEPEQMASMIPFEAQQYVPFPLDEVVLGHQVVSDESDDMATVMIVAARMTLLEALLSVFDRAGLEVSHISVSALALAEHARGAALPVALLEVDGGELDLAVVSADKLLFSRAASLHGGRTGAPASADQLTAEVARSLAAYQNEHRSAPVSRVLVAGRASELTDVQQALDGLLDIPVGPLTSPMMAAADPSAAAYAVATGLALQAGSGGISTIDLVPPSRTERKVAARRRVHTVVALAASAAAVAAVGFYLTGRLSDQADEAKKAAKENTRLDMAKKALGKVNVQYEQVAKAHQAVLIGTGRGDKGKPMVDVVKAVSDAIPKTGGIYLTQLSFERGASLVVHGNTSSEVAATDLVLALQSSGAFKEVRLTYLGDNTVQATTAAAGPRRTTRPAAGAGRAGANPAPGGAASAPRPGGPLMPGASGVPGGQPLGGLPAPNPGLSGMLPDMGDFDDATDTTASTAARTKASAPSMSFTVTCKVIGAEQKDFIDKPKRTGSSTTLAADRRNP